MRDDEKKTFALSAEDREILKFLQEDLPLLPHPYRALAEQLHITEEEVICRMTALKETGALRRVGVLLNHGRAGYKVNALTAWKTEASERETLTEALERIAKALAAFPFVSHCYLRDCPPGWEYPVFAMVHAESEEALARFLKEMEEAAGTKAVRVMKTLREWKKTSMRYL